MTKAKINFIGHLFIKIDYKLNNLKNNNIIIVDIIY